MTFLSNLAKGFVRSAVNQVGRDGGKVISNKIYHGNHGTPVYNSGGHFQEVETIEVEHIEGDIQPTVQADSPVTALIKGVFIQIIPVIGFFWVIIKAIGYFRVKSIPIYVRIPNKISDKRYKEGYRIDGLITVKSNSVRELTDKEESRTKKAGWAYLLSIPAFFVCLSILAQFVDSDKKQDKLATIRATHGLHLRDNPSSNSNTLLTIPHSDTLKLINPSDTINIEWAKVEYKGKEGWVSKEYIKEI
jgi:hypothetical protein